MPQLPSTSLECHKPLEYWISRSIDPYVSGDERKHNIEILCDRVNAELDGATVVTDILCHKVLSPDQDEAYNALQVVNELMRNCGEKVHIRVGKFRFLNQLVKLITPKYLGSQTSSEVKELAIRLLYTWQKTIRHVPKFKEVYDSLKEYHYIAEDPKIPEEEVLKMPKQLRMAEFETEETATKIKELLKAKNFAEANKFIAKLVQQKEEKEQQMKLIYDLQYAIKLSEKFNKIHQAVLVESIGLAPSQGCSSSKEDLECCIEEIGYIRPRIVRYIQEVADSGQSNDHLMELIQCNESLTNCIKKLKGTVYEPMRRGGSGSEEENADLLGSPDLNGDLAEVPALLTSSLPSQAPMTSTAVVDPFELVQPITDESMKEHPDVPFIGFDRILTPQLPRRTVKTKQQDHVTDLNILLETDFFSSTSPPKSSFAQPKPTLNELCHSAKGNSDEEFCASLLHKYASDLEVMMDKANLKLENEQPLRILDKMNIQILITRATVQDASIANVYLVSILNIGIEDIDNIRFSIGTSCSVKLQIEEGVFSLQGISPLRSISTEHKILRALPLKEINEIDIDFSLSFTMVCERRISGSFTLPINT